MIEISTIFEISAVSFLLALALTPIARDVFLAMGILDQPDGRRKIHAHPVPRVGGIPIVLSYAAAFVVLLFLPGEGGNALVNQLPFVMRVLPAAGVIFITGLIDDIYGLEPWQKLTGQIGAAAWAGWIGVRIQAMAGFPLGETFSAVLTITWLIGCTNAFNLIDGLDGLASGMGLFSTLTIFVAALLQGDHALALATLPLCGSLLGFLRYNFNPASVFLGDSGSLLIGFLLGCYGIIWSQKSATLLGITAPLMALAIPLLDVTISILRRWLRGKPIFGADRNHIHHKLLDRGLTHKRVVIVLYLVCGIYATLSLLQSLSENRFGGLILVLFCAVTWIGVQNLGYFEFGLASKVVLGGAIRRVVHGQIVLHGMEKGFDAATTVDDCWRSLEESARQFGFRHIRARMNGQVFQGQEGEADAALSWQLRIPLPDGDYVNLSRDFDAALQPVVVGPLIETLHRKLAPRLAGLRSGLPETETTNSVISLASGVGAYEPQPAPVRNVFE